MRLNIIIKKAPQGCSEMIGKRFTYEDSGLTFGRAHNNDLVLPDPENFVSSSHGRIDFLNGQFTVFDQSANGLYLNKDTKPLGPSNNAVLTTDTQLRAGNYQLVVEVVGVAAAAPKSDASAGNAQVNPVPKNNQAEPSEKDLAIDLAVHLGLHGMSESQLRAMPAEVTTLLRRCVGSLMDVLSTRRQVKTQLKMDTTVIQTAQNNPLKVSKNEDDAIEAMFVNSGETFLDPEQALIEAFEDIGDHQVAIMAASLQVYQQVIDRFEPAAIEKFLLNSGAAGSVFSGKRKSWDEYKQNYESIASNGSENIKEAFLHEFSSAYEERLLKLKRDRSKNST